MADPGLFDEAVKIAAGGAGAGGGIVGVMFLVRWFITFMAGRADLKEDRLTRQSAELDTRWKEYRETLEGRLVKLEGEVERCHAEKHNLETRVAELEGFAVGRGEAVQLAQKSQSLANIFKDKEQGQ